MDKESDKCTLCGGTDSELIDGFYYCVECGTQNTNVRETVIEDKALGDGTFAVKTRKKIRLKKDGIEMSGEWYKWHAFNFIISGLADELITLGAKPTFKMKLLWIWTRYIKKYQNKLELMMNKSTADNDITAFNSFMVEEDDSNITVEGEEDTGRSKNKCDIKEGSKRDIHFLSRGLIIAMLYISLNLDESDIQLSHLYRFIQENHLNILNINRFIPSEINVKKIPQWINFLRSKLCTQHQIRGLAMSLLRKLDLGTPKVPNLRHIVDNILTELCLSNDIKPFVYSLMHLRKCDVLDVDNKSKNDIYRLPDYEGTVMTYILIAIKIVFGLDSQYEIKLSDVVDNINTERDLPKSYKIGKYSANSDRLFSYREWCNYLIFRKTMLSKYCLKMAERNGVEIDEYIQLEHLEEKGKGDEKLSDKITMDVIRKLPDENPVGVIPKDLFVPSLTPMSEYTDVIIAHCQDCEVKEKLSEDFRRYSLKYACEYLELKDVHGNNIVIGVNHNKKVENDSILGNIVTKKVKTKMIYIKNCDNKNWMMTNPPTMEHVTFMKEEDTLSDKDEEDTVCNKDEDTGCDKNEENTVCNKDENTVCDKDSDHGYDSENTCKEKDLDSLTDEVITNVSNDTIIDNENTKVEVSSHLLNENIQEEETDRNIFDDCFEDIDLKEEIERDNAEGHDDQIDVTNNEVAIDDFDRRSDVSDVNDEVMPVFNPDTFDRDRTIKELILLACNKYKIVVPPEYKVKEPRKKRNKVLDHSGIPVKRRRNYNSKATVQDLLNGYYKHLETDFANKVQQEMSLAINNFENDIGSPNVISVIGNNTTVDNDTQCSRPQSETSQGDVNENNDVDATEASVTDENFENMLFENDKMKIDDIVTKGDPKFDEKDYDTEQLYIKIKDVQNDTTFDINDEEIHEIIDKKIEECKNNNEYEDLREELKKEEKIKVEESDSEDEIPLSVMKEEMMMADEMYKQEDSYERLISKGIPEYKYWIRHYDHNYMVRSTDMHTKFSEELKENTPTSFYFVIDQCAAILNCTKFYLYKSMQNLEKELIIKTKSLPCFKHDTSSSGLKNEEENIVTLSREE